MIIFRIITKTIPKHQYFYRKKKMKPMVQTSPNPTAVPENSLLKEKKKKKAKSISNCLPDL